MYLAGKGSGSRRVCIKLVLLVLFLSPGGASVLPGLLSPGSTAADPAVSAAQFDLMLRANGEVVVYRRGYSP